MKIGEYDSIVLDNGIINQNKWFDNDIEESNKNLLRKKSKEIEEKDLQIRKSFTRKRNGWLVDGKIKRTLLSSIGVLSFTRTKYKRYNNNLKKWESSFLVDDYFQIEKYQKLTYEFKCKIINMVSRGSRLESIIKTFPFAQLNKSTLSRFIAKLNIADLNSISELDHYKIPDDIDKFDTVYISTDDCFPKLKINRVAVKHRIRLGIMYLGISKKPDSRNSRLIHKRVIFDTKHIGYNSINSVAKFIEIIKDSIKKYYGNKEWKIVVSGDGDKYIKRIANEFGAKIVLDKFHLFKEMKKVWPKFTNHPVHNEMYGLFKEQVLEDPEHLIKKMPDIIKKFPDKKLKLLEFKRYLTNNLPGINAWQEDWYNGCYTEGNVWHYVKSITKGKSYGLKSFTNILNLRISYINNLDPISVWKREIENSISLDYQDRQWWFPNFVDNSKKGYMPALESKNTKLANLLRTIKDN